MKNYILIFVFTLLINSTVLAEGAKHSFKPKQGYVPNAETAIKIAEAIWLPVYGESIYKKRPFVAKLQGEVWVVYGSLPLKMRGGVPVAEISKETGKILRISHGK